MKLSDEATRLFLTELADQNRLSAAEIACEMKSSGLTIVRQEQAIGLLDDLLKICQHNLTRTEFETDPAIQRAQLVLAALRGIIQ